MSLRYRSGAGVESILAGLTPGGDIEYGAVAQRSGTFEITDVPVGGDKAYTVTFSDPMPDDDYTITFEQLTSMCLCSVTDNTKTANGFEIKCRNLVDVVKTCKGTWYATKTYTVQHAEQNAEDITEIKSMIPAGAGPSNKLATSNDVANLSTEVDGRLDNLEDVVPTSASITNKLVTESEASVDSALSATSEHAVQNKVVKAALDDKQDILTFDNVPTANSNNPVKSSGIYNTANDIYEVMSKNGAKNLLPNQAKTQTIGGVTYTINNDGTIDMQGTNTSGSWISLNICNSNTLKTILNKYKGQRMIFSTTQDYEYDTRNVCLYYNINGENTYIVPNPREKEFTVPDNIDTATSITVPVGVNVGETANTTNLGIMLRLASDTDLTYQPYAMTNQQITPYVQTISNPNLLDNPWFTVNQRGVTNAWTTGYGVDRWTLTGASVAVQTNKSLNFTWDGTGNSGIIGQFFEDWSVLNGKTVTASAIIDDKLYSITFPNVSETNNRKTFELGIMQLNFSSAWGRIARPFQILINDTTTHNIKAVKLELGSVSTLAMDTAPNYATELAKCQRYFKSIPIGELGGRLNSSGNTIRLFSSYTENMRSANKTAQLGDQSDASFELAVTGAGTQVTLIWTTDFTISYDNQCMGVILGLTNTGQTKLLALKGSSLGVWKYANSIWVSADL